MKLYSQTIRQLICSNSLISQCIFRPRGRLEALRGHSEAVRRPFGGGLELQVSGGVIINCQKSPVSNMIFYSQARIACCSAGAMSLEIVVPTMA